MALQQEGAKAVKGDGQLEINETSGVNLINILRKTFLHESAFCSFSLIKVWLCDFLLK